MKHAKISTVGIWALVALLGCSGGTSDGAADSIATTSTKATESLTLPSPAGASITAAIAVDGGNKIAGWSAGLADPRAVSWTASRAVTGELVSAAPVEHLPLPGNFASAAYGIGDGGNVVGESQSGTTVVPVVWLGGSVEPTALSLTGFSPPGAAFAMAGTRIVGQATSQGRTVAVLWTTPAATPAELGTLDSDGTSRAYAISADGSLAVGEATDNGATRAVVWSIAADGNTDNPEPLNPLAGDVASVAFGVNGNIIVGESEAADGTVQAVRWTISANGNISAPLAIASGSASGVFGQRVVGHSGERATLWDLGNLATPELLVPAVSQALGINGSGTIVGIRGDQAFVAAVDVGGPATGVTLTPSVASPQPVGSAVTFNAQGIGGDPGAYQYRFYFKLSTAANYTMVQDYGVGSSWTLPTNTPAGSYRVLVYVRTSPAVTVDKSISIGYTLQTAPATGVTVTPSLASPRPVGTPVVFTAQGEGGGGTYQYRFYFKPAAAAAYTMVQDYGVGSSWTLPTNTPAGSYRVLVYVRTSPTVTVDKSRSVAYSLTN